MPHNPKPNEWNLLKEQFDQMVRSEIVQEDYTVEPFLDDEIRRHFGEWITRAIEASGKRGLWYLAVLKALHGAALCIADHALEFDSGFTAVHPFV